MDLHPAEITLDQLDYETQFTYSTVTHRYNTEEEVLPEHVDKVRQVCKSYERSETITGLRCGYFLTIDLEIVDPNVKDPLLTLNNFVENINSVPEGLRDLYLYDCIQEEINYFNPSDHNPIVSCLEF